MRPPLLTVEGLSKRYGAATVLDGIDLEVGTGNVVSIRGENGSGKSTFLRIAATLTSPSSGQLTVNGIDALKNSADARRHTGSVMHSPMLYSDLTVRENLALFAKLCQLESSELRVEQAASRLQLEDRMDDRVRRLSHGYRKRVSIARAILHTPSLLLLDEPETGLDDASMLVLSEIIEEWRSNGRAVLIATHSSDFVNGLADIAFTMVSRKLARLNGLMID